MHELTQAVVVGEHLLQPETVLPLVPASFTVARQRHVRGAVADVVWGHDGAYRVHIGSLNDSL